MQNNPKRFVIGQGLHPVTLVDELGRTSALVKTLRVWPCKPYPNHTRYDGEALRQLRAERGVGRPPKFLKGNAQ